ncbi:hypothetical protein [Pseudarcicella hirudinis]|nr:hypothetical protein [Pseudarcicella hirudinis]
MLRILIFSVFVGIVLFTAPMLGLGQYVHAEKWFILTFFVAVSYLNHLLMQMGFANDREKFVPFYMASIGFRLILSVCFIGTFIYLKTPDIYTFIADFFVLYLFYTGFEIYGLYRNLRHFS